MEKILLILLILTGTIFIIQTILGFISGSDELDMPSDGEGAGPTGFLTIRNMNTFLLGFSAAGYILLRGDFPMSVAIIAGIVFGALLSGSIIAGMRLMMHLEQKNEIQSHEYRGLHATVTVKIEPTRQSMGKVEFSLRERLDELPAVTDETEALKRGEQVQVVRLLDNGTLLVSKTIIY